LCISGPVDLSLGGSSLLNAVNPKRGLRGVPASNDCHSEISDREQDPANGFVTERTVIDRVSLDEQVRPKGRAAEAAKLSPKAAVANGEVQTSRRLALDSGDLSDQVVTDHEMRLAELNADLTQRARHSTRPLVDIDSKLHRQSVPREMRRICDVAVPITPTSDFAHA
jgi:hypothetical protein